MQVSLALEKLVSLFEKPIFIVGGFVRDSLLNFQAFDVDICGSIQITEIEQTLKDKPYELTLINKRMGTVSIKDTVSGEKFEYTSFRKEFYEGGEHVPKEVIFVDDMETDAKRRDFTINAIYYDIKNRMLVDPLGGGNDMQKRIIRTCDSPQVTFGFDGLRLMRLCRFACSLDFDIDEKTFSMAREMQENIKCINKERIRAEFELILHADTKYNVEYAHFFGVKKLHEIGVLKYIVPQLIFGENIKQRADYHAYDVFNHALYTFKYSSPKIRLAALLHDIGKPYVYKKTGKMIGHNEEGEKIAVQIMQDLKYPNKQIETVSRLVKNHMLDLDCSMSEWKVKIFIVKNLDILNSLLLLKNADYLGGGLKTGESPTVVKWRKIYEEMLKGDTPMSTRDLKITSGEIIEYFSLEGKAIKDAVDKLFFAAVKNPKINESKQTNVDYLRGVL